MSGRGKGVAKGGGSSGPDPPPIEMLFQVFRLNFCWDMPKMHYFSNKFSKITKRPLIFDFGDLKLRDMAKFCFSSWLWRNRTSKNQLLRHFSDVMAIMSPKNVIKTSQNFSILGPPIKISGYASEAWSPTRRVNQKQNSSFPWDDA